MKIGIYNNKSYRLAITKEKKLFLMHRDMENGFEHVPDYYNYKDELITNLYQKEITENDLEDAYALKYEAVYKGVRFEAFQVEDLFNKGKMQIWTENDDIAEKYDFERMDMYWYYKFIEEKDIEELVEIREPIFKFKDTKKVTKQVIPKDKILQYSEYIASFA
ncbi:MAG: hypothetical protein GYA50_10175 [Eubacteriaceae bacterium]|nr:hypothetical protein [Eubacteriaceae bacterium]